MPSMCADTLLSVEPQERIELSPRSYQERALTIRCDWGMEPNERIELSSRRYEGQRPARDIRQVGGGGRNRTVWDHNLAYEASHPTRGLHLRIDGAPCRNRTGCFCGLQSQPSPTRVHGAWWAPRDSNPALRGFKPVCLLQEVT